jgi:(2Fe-2S) ferredoxin
MRPHLDDRSSAIPDSAPRSTAIRTCYVCVHVWCAQAGSLALKQELRSQLADIDVEVRQFLCIGCCPKAPNIVLYPEGTWYPEVQADDVPEIVAHIRGGAPAQRLTARAKPDVQELILKMLDRYQVNSSDR